MSDMPVLETERLILRAHRLDDFPAFAAMWAEPLTVRYISGKPSTENQSWMRLLTFSGLWPLLGFGIWAVEEKRTGAYAGQVGFSEFRREIEPSLIGTPEIGWVFAPAFHGRGFASESVSAALRWSDALAVARTVCIVGEDNLASLRVAEKAGYREFARTVFNESAVVMLERFADCG